MKVVDPVVGLKLDKVAVWLEKQLFMFPVDAMTGSSDLCYQSKTCFEERISPSCRLRKV